jgi:hypothetical protein
VPAQVYGMNEWREDLKSAFKVAGVDGKPSAFLFADTQIKLEGFVEDVNNILNTGAVPNLFAKDEQVSGVWFVCPCVFMCLRESASVTRASTATVTMT